MQNDDLSVEELVNESELPNQAWDKYWSRIYVDEDEKEKLVNYGLLLQQFQEEDLDRMTLSHHGVILLTGPPGTGKTSLAMGAANELSKRVERNVVFKRIEVQHLFSGSLGDTPKLVENAFQQVIEPARNPENDTYQVLLLDEVESLFSSRSMLSGDTDPMDAVRAVNTALEAIDELSELPGVYLIATSNQPRAVDRAYYDRTDDQIFLGNPEAKHRKSILLDIFRELNETLGAELPTEPEAIEEAVAKTEGFSGRRIRKTVLAAISRDRTTVKNPSRLSYDQVLDEIERTYRLIREKGSSDYINLGDSPDEALPDDELAGTESPQQDPSQPNTDFPSQDEQPAAEREPEQRDVSESETEDTLESDAGQGETERTVPTAEAGRESGTEQGPRAEATEQQESEPPVKRDSTTEPADVGHIEEETETDGEPSSTSGSEMDDAAEQHEEEWLDARTAVFKTTKMNKGEALCEDIATYLVETLEQAGYQGAEVIETTLTGDEMVEKIEELCMRRSLSGLSMSVGDFRTTVEVEMDTAEEEHLVPPAEGAVPSLDEEESITLTLLVESGLDTNLPDVNQDGIEINIKNE